MQARVNRYDCRQCGREIQVDSALLYHNMRLQTDVQYYPVAIIENPDLYLGLLEMNQSGFSKYIVGERAPDYLFESFMVFDMNERRQEVFR